MNFLCLVAWGIFTFGCSPAGSFSTVPPSDTEKSNLTRAQIGIRPIKKEWTFYGREFHADKWKDGTNLCKMVQRNNSGGLLWEQDYYDSGASYATEKGTEWEFLSVNYDYSTKQVSLGYVGTNAAIRTLFQSLTLAPFGPKDRFGSQTHSHVGTSNQETLAVADKVLSMWGRTRL